MNYIIVIIYNPEFDTIRKWNHLIEICTSFKFIIVDNSDEDNALLFSSNCKYIPLHHNTGIATAQNTGISYALIHGATNIVFFDQDSDVPEGYFESIVSEYKKIKNIVPNLAMLGPTVINKETNENYKTKGASSSDDYVLTSTLISSGTVAEINIFKEIGLMDDSLFIDGVDFEWCWRAVGKGYVCARTQRVSLLHKVGQQYKLFLGYPIIVSSPTRYFYQYRNFLKLIRRDYVPRSWKIKTSIRRFVELFVVPFYADKKWETFHQMLRGIKAGLINR